MGFKSRRERTIKAGYGIPFQNPEGKKFFVFIYDKNSNNLGDLSSCPLNYFDFSSKKEKPLIVTASSKIMRENERWKYYNTKNVHFIFGGGGLLTGKVKKMFSLLSDYRAKPEKKRTILWGIGYNENGHKIDYKTLDGFFKGFDLVGLRDYNSPYIYVPCSSCMNKVFDKKPNPPEHKVVIYDHYGYPIPRSEKYPIMSNNETDLNKVIKFLSSGETVVTSAFHGVYWSMLLNRKVVIIPSASRFYGFKHPAAFRTNENWESGIDEAQNYNYNGYLDECREINKNFYKKVMSVLGL